MTMTEEGSKNQTGEGGACSQPATAKEPRGALGSSVSPPPATTTGTAIARRPAQSLPPTLAEAEEGHATARMESVEQCQTAKVKSHLELGCMVALFSFAVLSGWLCLPKEAKHPDNVWFGISLLMAFATFLSGTAQILLSMNMLGLPENLVSGGQRVVSKYLTILCTVLPVMTLLSFLALLPNKVYQWLGLAVITAVMLLLVAVYWYLPPRARAEGGDEAVAYEEHKEELDKASKITWCATSSAFGGLVGVLFRASKSKEDFGARPAVYVAIFFMFSTAIFGMLVMTVSKKVPKVTNRRLRKFLVSWVISLANAFLLCSLACAAFAASFEVIGCLFFASFAPLAITGVIYFTLQHFTVRRGHADQRNQDNEEARFKAMEDIASKLAAATMGAIMTVLAVSVGENRREKMGATDLFMGVLTSTFVSSFGFLLLASMPSSARSCLAPISKLLVWSSVGLFAAAAVYVYGAEAFMAAGQ